jgi:hypothetical protein
MKCQRGPPGTQNRTGGAALDRPATTAFDMASNIDSETFVWVCWINSEQNI